VVFDLFFGGILPWRESNPGCWDRIPASYLSITLLTHTFQTSNYWSSYFPNFNQINCHSLMKGLRIFSTFCICFSLPEVALVNCMNCTNLHNSLLTWTGFRWWQKQIFNCHLDELIFYFSWTLYNLVFLNNESWILKLFPNANVSWGWNWRCWTNSCRDLFCLHSKENQCHFKGDLWG